MSRSSKRWSALKHRSRIPGVTSLPYRLQASPHTCANSLISWSCIATHSFQRSAPRDPLVGGGSVVCFDLLLTAQARRSRSPATMGWLSRTDQFDLVLPALLVQVRRRVEDEAVQPLAILEFPLPHVSDDSVGQSV